MNLYFFKRKSRSQLFILIFSINYFIQKENFINKKNENSKWWKKFLQLKCKIKMFMDLCEIWPKLNDQLEIVAAPTTLELFCLLSVPLLCLFFLFLLYLRLLAFLLFESLLGLLATEISKDVWLLGRQQVLLQMVIFCSLITFSRPSGCYLLLLFSRGKFLFCWTIKHEFVRCAPRMIAVSTRWSVQDRESRRSGRRSRPCWGSSKRTSPTSLPPAMSPSPSKG